MLADSADFLAEIERQVAGKEEFFRLVEGHLLDEGEEHLDLCAHFERSQSVVAFGEIEGQSRFGVESWAECCFPDSGEQPGAAENVVEVVDVGIVAHDFRESGVVVEDFHVVGDGDAQCRSCRQGVVDLHAAPIGLQVEGALVAIAALQKKGRVELAIPDGAHVSVQGVDRTHGFGVFVVHQLHLPEVLVVEVGGAAVLEADPEAGRVREYLHVVTSG